MAEHQPIPDRDEDLAKRFIGVAIEVHRNLGPGYLESIYQRAIAYELIHRKIEFEQEKEILVPYKNTKIPGQRLDLRIGGRLIVELKCVDSFLPIHRAQLLSYLRATRLRLGLLVNFKTPMLKDGIERVVN